EYRRQAVAGDRAISITAVSREPQHAKLGIADASGIFEHRMENGSEFARRAADDLQHLRGRGLLFQRLRQFLRARLDLVEQAHILDCNYRLVGKSLEQFNLLLGERPQGATL